MSIIDEYKERLISHGDIEGHMPFLRETAAGHDKPVIIELGVRFGQSTASFLAALEGNGGGELWSVDINDPDVPAHWHDLPYWHFLKADDRSPEALEWLPASCDLLFIDTSHELEHTLEELRLYVPKVRRDGCVLMHDTELPAPPEDAGSAPYVARALDAYCKETGLRWENRPGSYGLGVIRL